MPEEVRATPAPASPTDEAEHQEPNQEVRVKVRIDRRSNEVVIDLGGRELPPKALVLNALPAESRRIISRRHITNSYYYVTNLIETYRASIPLSVWAAAIGKALIYSLHCDADEGEALVDVGKDGYLCIGDMLYQLNPIQLIKTNKALAPMKRKLLDEVKQRTADMIDAAQAQARAIIQAAREKDEEANYKLQEAIREAGVQPPKAFKLHGYPLRFYNNIWEVGFWLRLKLTRFVMAPDTSAEMVWNVPTTAVAEAKPVLVPVWMPLEDEKGRYSITRCHLDHLAPAIPHMTTAQACLSVADAPAVLTPNTLPQLQAGMERCFRTVNMSSLYQAYSAWRDNFKAYIPTELLVAIYNSANPQQAVADLYHAALAERERRRVQAATPAPAPAGGDVWSVRS